MGNTAYGSFAWSTPTEQAHVANTPEKGEGTTTSLHLANFTMPSNNRLTYTDTTTRTFSILACLSVKNKSDVITCWIYKNGSVSAISMDLTTQNINDAVNVEIVGTISLAQNDYVEIWIESTADNDLTIVEGCMIVSLLC
jgi:hypothetical protein